MSYEIIREQPLEQPPAVGITITDDGEDRVIVREGLETARRLTVAVNNSIAVLLEADDVQGLHTFLGEWLAHRDNRLYKGPR